MQTYLVCADISSSLFSSDRFILLQFSHESIRLTLSAYINNNRNDTFGVTSSRSDGGYPSISKPIPDAADLLAA